MTLFTHEDELGGEEDHFFLEVYSIHKVDYGEAK